jgi:hypothetical protein
MSEGAYPTPIHDHGHVDGEKLKREFAERQKRRAAEIREWKRKRDAALKAGDMQAVRRLGPRYS